MQYLLGGLLFGGISILVFIAMARLTNKKVNNPSEDGYIEVLPYGKSIWTYTVLTSVILISALCGGLIFQSAISTTAIIKLGLCYFAILGAAVIDFKLCIIPNFIPITLISARVLIFLYELMFENATIQDFIVPLISCLLCGLFLLLGNKISKGGIGSGDIKLLVAVGLMCGAYTVFTSLLLALLCCSAFAIVVTLTKKMTLKQSVPFGPFIYMGYTLMCLLTMY